MFRIVLYTFRRNLRADKPLFKICFPLCVGVYAKPQADFVFDLPQGLDTPCSEAGRGFSEGQAQRIAIARALLRRGAILLMDEPTSSLDASTERQLLKNLSDYAAGRTVIIVTHRPLPEGYATGTVNLDMM